MRDTTRCLPRRFIVSFRYRLYVRRMLWILSELLNYCGCIVTGDDICNYCVNLRIIDNLLSFLQRACVLQLYSPTPFWTAARSCAVYLWCFPLYSAPDSCTVSLFLVVIWGIFLSTWFFTPYCGPWGALRNCFYCICNDIPIGSCISLHVFSQYCFHANKLLKHYISQCHSFVICIVLSLDVSHVWPFDVMNNSESALDIFFMFSDYYFYVLLYIVSNYLQLIHFLDLLRSVPRARWHIEFEMICWNSLVALILAVVVKK